MATRSHQLQFIFAHAVEEQPIGANVAVPVATPVANQCMVTVFVVQWFLRSEDSYDSLHLGEIDALSCQPLDIMPKSSGLSDLERHRLALPICEEIVN